ncbi:MULTISPECIES: ROK family protein [Enterococcus]|uniref:ROK family protein n=1 Tax=Enterococcus TaxID=1350 RepID=UPI001163E4FC|nr:ROK family protein [Enterococcus avium]HAP3020804.1 ROK family protein [Enterococcus faecalis]AYQ24051.1 hypothetical protein AUF16_05045 [Enterococcus avium]HBI1561140.1 ROK family protein [Enterococcus faecalis]HBI1564413.1 ROK family protein [Enterococcus faecalis]HBI1716979.1 ROK family protein [Enterococcus faecalis]
MARYLCFDIGGTSLKYALINESAEIIHQWEQPTQAHLGGPFILQTVCEIVKHLKQGNELLGVAISTAGMVNPEEGSIFYAGTQIPNYAGTQFKKVIEEEFALPCEVENDVNCAGLAEGISGAGKDASISVCLTIGTGIGGCILLDKKVFHGFSNSACEVGYMHHGKVSFQDLASTTALVQRVSQLKQEDISKWNGRKIFELAKAGDVKCEKAIQELVEALCEGISNICCVLNPEVVILGGGIMTQVAYLRPLFEQTLPKYLISSILEKTTLTFAKHQNNAGFLGAFYHFKQKHP